MKRWSSRLPDLPERPRLSAPAFSSGRIHLAVLMAVIGLMLLGAAAAPTIERVSPPAANPTPTVKVCHVCDEEMPEPESPLPSPTCDECAMGATRAANLATAIAGQRPAAATRPAGVEATQEAFRQSGTVTAILFWMNGCPDCHHVLDDILPRVQQDFDEAFRVQLVEVLSQEDVDYLFLVGAALGVPQEKVGVPFLIIGEHVLVGSTQVEAELPGLIARYLAAGGVQTMAPLVSGSLAAKPRPTASVEGYGLAMAVLVGAAVSLAYAGASLGGARLPLVRRQQADRLIPWLAALGLAVSLYLAYVEAASVQAACGPVGACNAVQSSAYARLFGVLPLGVLGALVYLLFLVASIIARSGPPRATAVAGLCILAVAFAGTAYSAYLTYVEVFVIRAVCLWCLASALTMSIILVLHLPAVHDWRERPGTASA